MTTMREHSHGLIYAGRSPLGKQLAVTSMNFYCLLRTECGMDSTMSENNSNLATQLVQAWRPFNERKDLFCPLSLAVPPLQPPLSLMLEVGYRGNARAQP